MTVSVDHLHAMLQAAHGRKDLATTWKVFRAVARHFEGVDWSAVEEAFKRRAEELGLTWVERS
jgi:hypothetical protein